MVFGVGNILLGRSCDMAEDWMTRKGKPVNMSIPKPALVRLPPLLL